MRPTHVGIHENPTHIYVRLLYIHRALTRLTYELLTLNWHGGRWTVAGSDERASSIHDGIEIYMWSHEILRTSIPRDAHIILYMLQRVGIPVEFPGLAIGVCTRAHHSRARGASKGARQGTWGISIIFIRLYVCAMRCVRPLGPGYG